MDRSTTRTFRRALAREVVAITLAAVTVAAAAHGGRVDATPDVADDPGVVTEWNAITVRTLGENSVPVPVTPLYLAFVALAVHDAVATIEGGAARYVDLPAAKAHASPEVAAAVAAHGVLRHEFPASAAALDADLAASLAGMRGVDLVHGRRVGRAAAEAIVALRTGDGRGAATPQPPAGDEPGEWVPTPPAFAPMAVPWLGFVTPLVIASPTAIPLPGPDAVDSPAFAIDLAEVQAYGAVDSVDRSPDQTATARFWNVPVSVQYQVAMRDQVADRGLDIAGAARAFAVLNTAMADAVIACWRAKYDESYWRPVTAIHHAGDADWAALVDTPPYPDYPSGHACLSGAASGSFEHLFGAALDLEVPSLGAAPARTFATAADLDAETMNARIWLGIHFRRAMSDGNALGHAAADQAHAALAAG